MSTGQEIAKVRPGAEIMRPAERARRRSASPEGLLTEFLESRRLGLRVAERGESQDPRRSPERIRDRRQNAEPLSMEVTDVQGDPRQPRVGNTVVRRDERLRIQHGEENLHGSAMHGHAVRVLQCVEGCRKSLHHLVCRDDAKAVQVQRHPCGGITQAGKIAKRPVVFPNIGSGVGGNLLERGGGFCADGFRGGLKSVHACQFRALEPRTRRKVGQVEQPRPLPGMAVIERAIVGLAPHSRVQARQRAATSVRFEHCEYVPLHAAQRGPVQPVEVSGASPHLGIGTRGPPGGEQTGGNVATERDDGNSLPGVPGAVQRIRQVQVRILNIQKVISFIFKK